VAQIIKGLLFDKDGTLFDFNATWASWAATFFQTLTGDRAEATGLGAKLGFDLPSQRFAPDSVIVAGTPEDIASAISKHLPHRSEGELISLMNAAAADAPQAEVTPLKPFLTALKRSYRLGVATNDAEGPARAHLDQAGITDLFDFIAGYDSGYGGKPEPGMQNGFCETLGLDPAHVVMVGDSTHDLIAGRRAGMKTVGVLTGLAPRPELAPHADIVLPSIKALPGWLAE